MQNQLPENIKEFAMRKGCSAVVNKINRWAMKVGKRITDGTAIGKYYDTLILDLRYHGSEIYFNMDTNVIELYGKEVKTQKEFVTVYNEYNNITK